MPLIPIDDAYNDFTPKSDGLTRPAAPDNTQVEVSTARSIKANFGYNNWVTNVLGSTTVDHYLKGIDPVDYNYIEQGYDFKNGVLGNPKYEQYVDRFANTTNLQQQRDLMTQIDSETEQKQVIAESSGLDQITGSLLAGVADPTILIPGFAVAKGARIASILKTASTGVALTGGAVAAQEGLLQATQETREVSESMYNIAAGSVLGGLLGAGAGALLKTNRPHGVLTKVLKDPNDFAIPETNLAERSASAAQANVIRQDNIPTFVSEEFRLKNPKAAEIIDKAITESTNIPGLKPASLEGITNQSAFVREITNDLFDHPHQLRSNLTEANGVPFELKNIQDDVAVARVMASYDDTYKSYAKRMKNVNEPVMKINQFDEMVFKAFNRGDVSSIEEVAAASRQLRKEIKDLNKKLVQYGRLTKEQADLIDNGDLTRVWNRKAVNERTPELREILTNELIESNRKSIAEAKLANQGQKEAKVKVPEALTRDEAIVKANEAIDSILKMDSGESALAGVMKASVEKGVRFTNDRTINIANAKIEDFLVNNTRAVVNDYLRRGNQMVRFGEFLDKHGAESINDLFTRLQSEYEQKLTGAMGDAKAEAKLRKDYKKSKELMDSLIKLSLGQFGSKSTPLTRELRKLNYVTMLGWMPMSAITDLAMPIFQHGPLRTMAGWAKLPRLLGSPEIRALAKNEMEDVSILLEVQTNSAIKSIYNPDITDNITINQLEYYTDKAVDTFTKATGMPYWNALGKTNELFLAEAKLSRLLKNYSKISDKEKAWLNQHFIGESDVKAILEQMEKHSVTESGMTFMKLYDWSNKDLASKVRGAIIKDLRNTIVTPGKGDIPLLAHSSELGKLLFQFKSFFSATTGRVLMTSLRNRDMNTVMGIMSMITLGSIGYVLRERLQGREPDVSANKLLLEGINRSGFLGMLSDPVFALVLKPLFGVTPTRFEAMQGIDSAFLGPSWSTIKGLAKLGYDIKNGEVDEKTMKQFWRLVPFQNLWYLDIMLRQAGLRGK